MLRRKLDRIPSLADRGATGPEYLLLPSNRRQRACVVRETGGTMAGPSEAISGAGHIPCVEAPEALVAGGFLKEQRHV